MSLPKELLVTFSISYIVDAREEEEAISQARKLLQNQMDAQDFLCLLTAEDFEARIESAVIEDGEEELDNWSCTLPCTSEVSASELRDCLAQLIKRIEETPFDRNEGMKGPMVAEAEALLERCNR